MTPLTRWAASGRPLLPQFVRADPRPGSQPCFISPICVEGSAPSLQRMAQPSNTALKAVSDAVLAVAAQQSVEEVLQQLVECARELAGARYAALGIPDGDGGFREFLTTGMSDELIAAMGPLPRTHGVLGAMLEETTPYRTEDLHQHPRFRGWWPRRHPDMRSFMGVPIIAEGKVIGAFYLTEKEGAATFDSADQQL